jgi:hypothetical protein
MTLIFSLMSGFILGSFAGFAAQSGLQRWVERGRERRLEEAEKVRLLQNLAVELEECFSVCEKSNLFWTKRPLPCEAFPALKARAELVSAEFLIAASRIYLKIQDYNSIMLQLRNSARFSSGGFNERLAAVAADIRQEISIFRNDFVTAEGSRRGASLAKAA